MYYSLDADGRLLDCNDTLLQTLGYRARPGRPPVPTVLAEPVRPSFAAQFAELAAGARSKSRASGSRRTARRSTSG